MSTFALIHSPLCGPATWQPVAKQLQSQGHQVFVPRLIDDEQQQTPLWQQQAQSIADALQEMPADKPIIWVAHSGAGLRLPAYRSGVMQPAAAYIFVDAGIPYDAPTQGMSQLEFIARQDSGFAEGLQKTLMQGRRFPDWTDEDLRDEIPDAIWRAKMMAELRPRGLRYFEELLPVFAGWPDAPCGFLHFSAGYNAEADYALSQRWAYHKIDASHFHMLVDPVATTQAIVDMIV